ncbi:hypothetical protein ACWT_0187 [Actinoplanes sp. SE50]|nr:hypothetical protein ACPL_303 [Actinoplanes sp. SE50/110]ATO79602.1 hypothetical protein ACWT_0187 [Actinoplanes sp. SE50]SLL97005.1 hypothetical protein ACSP50_0201 [Actinoplanes sp. SE50/110]
MGTVAFCFLGTRHTGQHMLCSGSVADRDRAGRRILAVAVAPGRLQGIFSLTTAVVAMVMPYRPRAKPMKE